MVNLLQCDYMITWLHIGDAFADRFNDTGSLVSEDNGKGTFWVLARESVRVCVPVSIKSFFCFSGNTASGIPPVRGAVADGEVLLTCMANSSVVNLNANLMSLWGSDLDGLKAQIFTCLPGHGGFASDCLNVTLVSTHAFHYLFILSRLLV